MAQIASIVDGCDGEIARLKHMESSYGAWLDAVLDRFGDALIILGMTYGYWILNMNTIIWIVGFLALIGSFLISYTADRYQSAFEKKYRSSKYHIPMGRDVRLFIIILGGLLNQVFFSLLILAIFTNLEFLLRLAFTKD